MIKPLRIKGLVQFVTSRYWVHPSNSKARRCRAVGIASIVAVGPLSSSSSVMRHTFWLCVASPSSRDRKLCTGSPWAFWCVRFFALAEAEGWAGRTGSRVPRLAWIIRSLLADYRLWLIGQPSGLSRSRYRLKDRAVPGERAVSKARTDKDVIQEEIMPEETACQEPGK